MRRLLVLVIAGIALQFSAPANAQTCSPGDQAQVLWKGTWYPASVRKAKGENCYIHYDGYGNNWDEWVGPERIRIIGAVRSSDTVAVGMPSFSEGDAVQVLWKGSYWPAHVLRSKGEKLYIHYDGYQSSWDEWVGPGRYKRP